MTTKKFILPESEIPTHYYNIVADMPNKPLHPLDPETKMPLDPKKLEAILPRPLIEQELSTERYIEIPEPVREIYKMYRPAPLIRATGLEKALGTDCKIFYKYEGQSPSGSHKPNTAIAQAYYNSISGTKKITTETGAGQWGTALSFACAQFGIECEVYMVRVSYKQKPYRKILMNTFGAQVYPSPSERTQSGRNFLSQNPQTPGTLGMAISEAIEMALENETTKYSLGSVLNHTLLHQTIIGQEALAQMEMAQEEPDIIIAPLGGGSNFAGLAFPFLRENLQKGKTTRFVAVEPASCPKLTQGKFLYDFGDTQGFTPLLPMYTLGHQFEPSAIHAGGLRYHGASVLCSQLLKDGLIEANAVEQQECFYSGRLFAQTEGIVPAPESNHAIAQVLREVDQAKKEGKSKVILFNLSGHGFVDMSAYSDYLDGKLVESPLNQEKLEASMDKIKALQPTSIAL